MMLCFNSKSLGDFDAVYIFIFIYIFYMFCKSIFIVDLILWIAVVPDLGLWRH